MADAYGLSDDRRTLVIKRRTPAGIQIVTIQRQDGAGPFTGEDVTAALADAQRSATRMQVGQRNITRRAVTRYGTLWTHVMLGPPTWWTPQVRREKDGTLMAGWLRAAVAVKFDRAVRLPWRCGWCKSLHFSRERRWSSWGWLCASCAEVKGMPGA